MPTHRSAQNWRGDLLQLDVVGASRILLCLLFCCMVTLLFRCLYGQEGERRFDAHLRRVYKIYGESIPLFMSGCESLGTVCFEDYFKVDSASSGHILDALARS